MPKHESTTHPGLFFWAERVEAEPGQPARWKVMGQRRGYPEGDALLTTFTTRQAAEEAAFEMAQDPNPLFQ